MKRILFTILFQFVLFCAFSQICNKGGQDTISSPKYEKDLKWYTLKDVSNQAGSVPNEIIGIKGYNALGDTLQWVAATASLPCTIYFENNFYVKYAILLYYQCIK